MRILEIVRLLRTAVTDWYAAEAPRLGAALAYYTLFSLAPALLIVVAIGGAMFGKETAREWLSAELPRFLGPNVAAAVDELVAHSARRTGQGRWAAVLGLTAMAFGATGAFMELKSALNRIWDVEPQPGRAIWRLVTNRLWSFAMVLCLGGVLAASVAWSALVRVLSEHTSDSFVIPPWASWTSDWFAALAITTLLFASLFKMLPDAQVPWRVVWFGAVVTALLFSAGKSLLGVYLERFAGSSAYGAAGSLVIILLWTYYSSQVFLLGAELTQCFAKYRGVEILPAPYAQRMTRPPTRFDSTSPK